MPKWKVASEPFLFLYMFSLGAALSLQPQITILKICYRYFNATVCGSLGKKVFVNEELEVYKRAAGWDTIIFASVYIPAIFTMLPVGAMADLICRKKILLFPAILVFIQNVIYFFCAKFMDSYIGFLAVGASITCLFGDVQGAIMLAYAYMASVSSPHRDRTVRMAGLEGSIFIGQGLGSYISGLLVEHVSFVAAYALTSATAFINIVFVVFILPPPPPVSADKPEVEDSQGSEMPSSGVYVQCMKNIKLAVYALLQFTKNHILKLDSVTFPLLIAAFFANSAILGENTILTLFLKYHPLSLHAEQIGLYYLTLHCVRGFGVTCLAFGLSKLLQLSDYTFIIIGLVSLLATHVSLSLATNVSMLFGFTLFSLGFPFALSTIRAVLTKVVSKEEEGTVLSCVGMLSLIGVTAMNFGANNLFVATANIFPGFSILLLSCSTFIALVIVCCLRSIYPEKNNSIHNNSQHELEPLMENDED